MAEFSVDVVGVSATRLARLWDDYGDDDHDCIENACATAGVYCDWIARHVAALKDPDELMRWSGAAVEVRVGLRKRLRARWELRAEGFLLVTP